MTNVRTLRSAPLGRIAGLARWAAVVAPLACGSAAFGEDLLATSGVLGLASSLGSMSDAEIQAFDARTRSEVIAAQAAQLEMQVLPRPVSAPRFDRSGAAVVEKSPTVAAPVTFLPPRPRTAEELRAASGSRSEPVPAASMPTVRPSVTAPARMDGPRPEVTRPVTGDRPAMPFSRLLSQVRY